MASNKGTALIRVQDEEAKRKVLDTLEREGLGDLLVRRDANGKGMPQELKRDLAAVYEQHGWSVPARMRPKS